MFGDFPTAYIESRSVNTLLQGYLGPSITTENTHVYCLQRTCQLFFFSKKELVFRISNRFLSPWVYKPCSSAYSYRAWGGGVKEQTCSDVCQGDSPPTPPCTDTLTYTLTHIPPHSVVSVRFLVWDLHWQGCCLYCCCGRWVCGKVSLGNFLHS